VENADWRSPKEFEVHKGILVALAFPIVFLAGCDSSNESQEAARYTPGHSTYVEDSDMWLMERSGGRFTPAIPPKLGDRGLTASAVAKYLNSKLDTIERCYLKDGAQLNFIQSGGDHVIVFVVSNSESSGMCKGEVAVSLGEFVRYRYNYLRQAKADAELRQLFASPK